MIGGDRELFVRRCLETETARRARARVDREKKKRRRLEDLSWLSGLHSECHGDQTGLKQEVSEKQ